MSTTPETRTDGQTPETPATPTVRERAKEPATGKGIVLTELAASKVKEILEKDSYPDSMYLFVGVNGGGCSGLQYVLDLRDESQAPASESDEVYSSHGIPVVCDLKSFVVGNLEGTVIDYQEGLMGAGFTFNNPNAKHSCGCGSSYSA